MKAKNVIGYFLFAWIIFSGVKLYSQEIKEENRKLSSFNAIEVGGAFQLNLVKGDENSATVISDEENIDKIYTEVSANTLEIYGRGLNNATKLIINLTYTNLERIEASGAAQVNSLSEIKEDNFTLEASGASNINLTLNVNELSSEISGAAKVKLVGTASIHTSEVSGAASLKSAEFVTAKTNIEVSGAANAKINATDEVDAEVTGAANLNNVANPAIQKIDKNGTFEIQMNRAKSAIEQQARDMASQTREAMEQQARELEQQARELEQQAKEMEQQMNDSSFIPPVPPIPPIDEYEGEEEPEVVYNDDSTKIIIRNYKHHHKDNDHSVVIIGDKKIIVDDEGVKYKKEGSCHKFNGHWGGLDLGINGYMNSDNKTEMPAGYEYLDLRYEKSINVDINLYEQNINLVNNHLGLITGIGLTYNNYRFDQNTVLRSDTNAVSGIIDNNNGDKFKKSKLLVNYLTVPLLLEYQTNNRTDVNSFHVTAGIIGGLRYGSHTKIVTNNGKMNKNHDDFNLNPFKLDATARIGWGLVNLYGTYSLTTLFKDGKDPELYPFSVGIGFDVNNW